MNSLIAHQGNWDEMLLFLAPIAVAFLAVRALERRSRRQRVDNDSPAETPGSTEN